jgi:glycosyltransferase involved in cell wall biosynthesis
MKRCILIIFPDEWLSHSPSILNLVRILEASFNVNVLALDDGTFRNSDLRDDRFMFIRINKTLAKTLLRRARPIYALVKALLLVLRLNQLIKNRSIDEVIAVDSVGLWAAQKFFRKCHFFSLEVKRDLFFNMSDVGRIKSIVIQSQERLNALFELSMTNVFFIQNSPSIDRVDISKNQKPSFNGKLVYIGNVIPNHGIYKILDAINCDTTDQLTLTIKGVIYKNYVRNAILSRYNRLIDQEKVVLDETYTNQDNIVKYLTPFSIGFCFYDFNLISKNDFNYLSSPSGKLFNYYAAGVPVIGTDVPGLSSVHEFKTGILIKELSADCILTAIKQIINNYEEFSRNCIRAARHFDFAEAASSYKEFLQSCVTG